MQKEAGEDQDIKKIMDSLLHRHNKKLSTILIENIKDRDLWKSICNDI